MNMRSAVASAVAEIIQIQAAGHTHLRYQHYDNGLLHVSYDNSLESLDIWDQDDEGYTGGWSARSWTTPHTDADHEVRAAYVIPSEVKGAVRAWVRGNFGAVAAVLNNRIDLARISYDASTTMHDPVWEDAPESYRRAHENIADAIRDGIIQAAAR